MNRITYFLLVSCISLSCSSVFAQTTPVAQNFSVKINKVTQIGHIQSGTTQTFILKASTINNSGVITDIHKISGTSDVGVARACLELASDQNLNAIAQRSNFLINFSTATASANGVYGEPISYEYTKVVVKSCYRIN